MIYLDNSATTELCESAKSSIVRSLENYGNPSSLHSIGFAANKELTQARGALMRAIFARSGRLIFTSCGSEASNLALLGTAESKSRRTASRIITTDSEHPSVENAMLRLEEMGFEIVRIPTKSGKLDFDFLNSALDKPIFMASIMLVNNETGAVYDVGKAFSLIKKKYPAAVCHCDAVQGLFKVKVSPTELNADYISISGHKIHAPKGVGALWVSDRIIKERLLVPRIHGGGQELGFRSGTENTIGIFAFAAAAEEGMKQLSSDIQKMSELRAYALKKLAEVSEELKFNLPEKAAPHVLSVTLPAIKSETMLHFLSSKGICVSSGSACSSHSNKPSASLVAFGLTPFDADCTIRISFSKYNTKEQIDALAASIKDGLDTLIRIKK